MNLAALEGTSTCCVCFSQDTQTDEMSSKDGYINRLESQVASLEAEVRSCRLQLIAAQAQPPAQDLSADIEPSSDTASSEERPESVPSHAQEQSSVHNHMVFEERLRAATAEHAARYAALRRQCLQATSLSAQKEHENRALKRRLDSLQSMCSGYERTVNSLLGLPQTATAPGTPGPAPAGAGGGVPSPSSPPSPKSVSATSPSAPPQMGSREPSSPTRTPPADTNSAPPSPGSDSAHSPPRDSQPAVSEEANESLLDTDTVHFFPSPSLVATFSVDPQRNRTAHRPPRPGANSGGLPPQRSSGGGSRRAYDMSGDEGSIAGEEGPDDASWHSSDEGSDDGQWSHSDDGTDEWEAGEGGVHYEHGGGGDDDDDEEYWRSLGVRESLQLPTRPPGDDDLQGIGSLAEAAASGAAVRAAVGRIQQAGASPPHESSAQPRTRSPLATSPPQSASDSDAPSSPEELVFHHGTDSQSGSGGAQQAVGSGSLDSSVHTEDASLESDDLFAYEREALEGYQAARGGRGGQGQPQKAPPAAVDSRPEVALEDGEPHGLALASLRSNDSWSPSYSPVTPEGGHSGRSGASSVPPSFPVQQAATDTSTHSLASEEPCAAEESEDGTRTAPASLLPRARRAATTAGGSTAHGERAYVVPSQVQLMGNGPTMRLQTKR